MGNIFNADFRDFLKALNDQDVRYMLVGGFSVILHGYPRTTGDMDIWVDRTPENYLKLNKAFLQFGMPVFDMTAENFLHHPVWDVFTFGTPPVAIDIMVRIKGFDFSDVYSRSLLFEEDGLQIRSIHKNDLIEAKKIAGRARDEDDIANLL
jgi:predicted nucleotidyltransferase